MWCCRAIRTLVSKPKRCFPLEARKRVVALQHLLGYVCLAKSYVYYFTEALDFHLLESVLRANHFISLNESSLGGALNSPATYKLLVGVLDCAATFTIYQSVLRRILRVVKHASKFESTLGQGRVAESWYRLKALALEHKKDMRRYVMEENKCRFICENQQVRCFPIRITFSLFSRLI